jgi:signal peptidase I
MDKAGRSRAGAGEKSGSGDLGETVRIIFHALILAVIIRTFFFQPFNIPSGSMKDTLLIGDYLFVSKMAYGYSHYSLPFSPNLFSGRIFSSKPQRGDVAVFKNPITKEDYIKRVIGLPGDEIQMIDGVLHINGRPVPKRRIKDFVGPDMSGIVRPIPRYEETLPNGVKYHVLDQIGNGPLDTTRVYKVPPGHYFMMGDNRDNSQDSRVYSAVGPVPLENFVGKAKIRFFSVRPEGGWLKFWNWPRDIRWSRIFTAIK